MGEARFGKYRLIAELGHGGMADVFLAVQAGPVGSGFKKLTVIKRLRQNLAEEPEFVAMLVDEARIAARLNHPNVVQTNEVGQVGPQEQRRMAGPGRKARGQRGARGLVDVKEADPRALGGEALHEGGADAGGAAGNEYAAVDKAWILG